ncbi:hypothetical protein [Dapis sp. BLCC M172]
MTIIEYGYKKKAIANFEYAIALYKDRFLAIIRVRQGRLGGKLKLIKIA